MAASFPITSAQELDCSKCNLSQSPTKERLSALGEVTPNFKSWKAINIQDSSVVDGKNLVPVEGYSLHTKAKMGKMDLILQFSEHM